MTAKHLSWFKVENFKRFDSLEVNDIGQFNLIVGDNNVGKTSLLEALLFDEESSVATISSLEHSIVSRGLDAIKSGSTPLEFVIKVSGKPLIYTFAFTGSSSEAMQINSRRRSSLTNSEIDRITAKLKLYSDEVIAEVGVGERRDFIFDSEAGRIDYFPLISFAIRHDTDLAKYFSKSSVSKKWYDGFLTSLSAFIPKLMSVELSNAFTEFPIVVVREDGEDAAKPLFQYGDGVLKLFRYLLEFERYEGRRLMIDEVDAGIHHSRMKDFLKQMLEVAQNKNVQIFATTHSLECLKYYAKALEELGLQEHGRIIRLANVKAGIKAYTRKFEEFNDELFFENEIR